MILILLLITLNFFIVVQVRAKLNSHLIIISTSTLFRFVVISDLCITDVFRRKA